MWYLAFSVALLNGSRSIKDFSVGPYHGSSEFLAIESDVLTRSCRTVAKFNVRRLLAQGRSN
eukprot:6174505-Pleurochrysis_carterae.AAC.2